MSKTFLSYYLPCPTGGFSQLKIPSIAMSNELLLEGLPGKSETLASPPVFALLLMALTRILQLPEQKSRGLVHAEAHFPAVPWRYESKSLLKLLLTD